MSTIINGTSSAITFPDSSVQNTSAIVSGYVPYANLPAGSVLQVVQGTYATPVSTSSSTFVTTNITASITPKFSTSKILIISFIPCFIDTVNGEMHLAIYKNNSININGGDLSDMYSGAGAIIANQAVSYLDSPATTSSTSYTIYMRRDTGGNAYSCVNSNKATIQLLEIAG